MLYKSCNGIIYSKFDYNKFFEKYNDCLLIMSAKDALDFYDEIKPYLIVKSNVSDEKYKAFSTWMKEQMWRVQLKNLEYEDISVIISIADEAIQWIFCEHQFYIDKVISNALPSAYYSKEIPLLFNCPDELNDDKDDSITVYRLGDAYQNHGSFHTEVERKYALTGMVILSGYYTSGDRVSQDGIKGFDWRG